MNLVSGRPDMNPTHDCNCDIIIAMEEAGVGVQELLQYAVGVLTFAEILALRSQLDKVLGRRSHRERAPAQALADAVVPQLQCP
jgi:hypothetical protein